MAIPKDKFNIKEIAGKWQKGTITEEERAFFDKWYAGFNDTEIKVKNSRYKNTDEMRHSIWQKIQSEMGKDRGQTTTSRILSLWKRVAVAASVLLAISAGSFYILRQHKPSPIAKNEVRDIAPGGNKAILTLGNGQQIVLTGAKNGTIASQNHTQINKTADGRIAYQGPANSGSPVNTIIYNKISTPVGGNYSIVLADGTLAVLDAASSIKYPVAFSGAERKVEITGQVYFEVVHNAAMPFRVSVQDEIIEDIGTHFNINAYPDEPAVKTTLLEGEIKISKGNHSSKLQPGQQAATTPTNDNIDIQNVNTEDVVAWKNGYFNFDNDDIYAVMRKLDRWYNIEPEFQRNVTTIRFGGTISRNKNISEILKVLSLTNTVHFSITGRRVIVMP